MAMMSGVRFAFRRPARIGTSGAALCGGGGNFGVVTSFEFRLHPVGPTVLAGPIFRDAKGAGEVLRFYRDFVREAPDELGTVEAPAGYRGGRSDVILQQGRPSHDR